MKIFWAWQSDIPGKISRHFIRSCLVAAIERLKQSEEIQEPTERERRGGLEIDHDRKGVAGSPDLAATILKKISDAAAFVGDVTPVGVGLYDRMENNEVQPRREVMNPNVAIELGYAFAKRSDQRVLMVLNTALGKREGLPFDIAHKGGPITFNLQIDASAEQIREEAKKLTAKLVEALEAIVQLDVAKEEDRPADSQDTQAKPFFFKASEVLAKNVAPGHEESFLPQWGPAVFLKLKVPGELSRYVAPAELEEGLEEATSFNPNAGGIKRKNDHGVIYYQMMDSQPKIESLTQVFRDGRLWGVDFYCLARGKYHDPKLINTLAIETLLHRSTKAYLAYASKKFDRKKVYKLEAGIVGVKGWALQVTAQHGSNIVGEMFSDEISVSKMVSIVNRGEVDKFLRQVFEAVFKDAGHVRPEGLYGFPGQRAYDPNVMWG